MNQDIMNTGVQEAVNQKLVEEKDIGYLFIDIV